MSMGGAPLPQDLVGSPLDDVVALGERDCIVSPCEGRVAIRKGHMKLCLNGAGFEMYKPVKIYRELYDMQKDPCSKIFMASLTMLLYSASWKQCFRRTWHDCAPCSTSVQTGSTG